MNDNKTLRTILILFLILTIFLIGILIALFFFIEEKQPSTYKYVPYNVTTEKPKLREKITYEYYYEKPTEVKGKYVGGGIVPGPTLPSVPPSGAKIPGPVTPVI